MLEALVFVISRLVRGRRSGGDGAGVGGAVGAVAEILGSSGKEITARDLNASDTTAKAAETANHGLTRKLGPRAARGDPVFIPHGSATQGGMNL
jgi:hypothetical protein